MPELPDYNERQLIEHEHHVNLLVEASAGSGKTHSLASRMVEGVARGHYRMAEVAAVTFTRQASSELRSRFQLALEKRLLTEPDPDRHTRLKTGLTEMERLFTGTIHSFCARILRERPVEARVAPGFTEIDETRDQDRAVAALWRYLEELRLSGSDLPRRLRLLGLRPRQLQPPFLTLCRFPEVDFPADSIAAPDHGAAWEGLSRFCRQLEDLAPPQPGSDTTCELQHLIASLLRRFSAWERSPANLARLLGEWDRTPRVVQKWWGASGPERRQRLQEVLALVESFQAERVRPYLEAWRAHVYGEVLPILKGARELYRRERLSAGELNYQDLLMLTADLLRERSDVLEALRNKFRWLLVDEFQDTDPLQAEIMMLLAGEGPEQDWTRITLRPGALFVVGDPKQSIYRFRRADMDTYREVREYFVQHGRVVTLRASFRSRPALCDWTNRVLGPAFASSGPEQAPFQELVSVRSEKDEPALHLLTMPGQCRMGEVPALEAARIARHVVHQVRSGRRAWKDFLVLTRIRSNLAEFAQALSDLGAPVECVGGSSYGDCQLVKLFAELVTVLADPNDEVGLVGLLRGPLFGVSDPELYLHRRSGGNFSPLSSTPGPVGEALALIRDLLEEVRTKPPEAVLELALERTGLLALSAASSSSGADAGHLLHALDRARGVLQEGHGLAQAAQVLLDDVGVHEMPLEPGRRDVVRVMNLHQAKGLEAPVVFLADCTVGAGLWADLRIRREGSAAAGYLKIGKLAQPLDWSQHEAIELLYQAAEEDRLLYVAATRAADTLIVSRWERTDAGRRPWAKLESRLGDVPELEDFASDVEGITAPPPSLEEFTEAVRNCQARHHTLRESTWFRSSVTARMDSEAHLEFLQLRPPPALASAGAGPEWGHLVHGLLEHVMERGPDTEELARLARWLTYDHPDLARFIPEALALVAEVAASPWGVRTIGATRRLAEVPFAQREGDTLIFGKVDLAVQHESGWELVDYKTHHQSLQQLAEHYQDQVRQYASSWAELTGEQARFAGILKVRGAELSGDLR